MESKEILNKIQKLIEDKKNILNEIEDIQTNCMHKNGFDLVLLENSEIKKLCKTCKLPIGYPTEKELKDNGFI